MEKHDSTQAPPRQSRPVKRTLSPAAKAAEARRVIALRREANIRENQFFNIPDKNPDQVRFEAVQSILDSRTSLFRTSVGGRLFLLSCALLLVLFTLITAWETAQLIQWIRQLQSASARMLIWPTGAMGIALLTFCLRLVVHCLRFACIPGPRCVLEEDRLICPGIFGRREFEYSEILKVTTTRPVGHRRPRLFNELLIYTMEDRRPWRLDISGLPEQDELFTTVDDIISWLHTEKLDSSFVDSMDQLARTTPDIVKSRMQRELLKRLFGSAEDITFKVTPHYMTRNFLQLFAIPAMIAIAWFLMSRRAPISFSSEYLALTAATALLLPFFIRPLLLLFRRNPPFILHHDMIECAGTFRRHTFFLKEIQKSKVDGHDRFYMNIKNRKYPVSFPAGGLNPPAHIMEYALNGLIHISEKDFLSFRELIERDVRFQDARDEYVARR